MRTYDLAEIDRHFPQIMEAIGWTPTYTTDTHLRGPCPIHQGTHANFHLDEIDGGRWIAICRSQCGGSGWTATRFIADLEGIPHSEAIKKAAEICRIPPSEDAASYLTQAQRDERDRKLAQRRSELSAELHKKELSDAIKSRRRRDLSPYLSDSWRADLWHDSPIILPPSTDEQARLLISQLYQPEDTLWLGETKDSGHPRHTSNFRLRDEWLEAKILPPRIAAGTFQPGSISRTSTNLSTTPYLIVESDDLIGTKPITSSQKDENKRLSAALFAFMADQFQLQLRAVVDTGNRSLHGWFDRPSPAAVEALLTLADALAIDAPVATQAQRPLRLPGCIHSATKRPAELCYLNPTSF